MNRLLFRLKLLVFLFLLSGCALFGSKNEVSEDEINQQAAVAYADVKAKNRFSSNQQWTSMVQRVAQRIQVASGENFKWESILIENSEVNAWCMPGGKIAVYTGIMPVLKTEAALAAVMGHEVAHATLRHGKKSYARAIEEHRASLILAGASVIGGELFCETDQCKKLSRLGGAAAGIALTFFNRKYSREDETEADRMGQIYMAKAGYNPEESIVLWERMNAAHGGKEGPEWASTHPSDNRRQNNLRSWLPETRAIYQKGSNQYGLGESIR